jgi:hypothetical protein
MQISCQRVLERTNWTNHSPQNEVTLPGKTERNALGRLRYVMYLGIATSFSAYPGPINFANRELTLTSLLGLFFTSAQIRVLEHGSTNLPWLRAPGRIDLLWIDADKIHEYCVVRPTPGRNPRPRGRLLREAIRALTDCWHLTDGFAQCGRSCVRLVASTCN